MENILSVRKAFINDSNYFGYGIRLGTLQCPVCSHEFIQLSSPIYQNGNDNYEAVDGMFRGDAIQIPFECEQGHTGNFYFAFHEGNTFYWAQDTTK